MEIIFCPQCAAKLHRKSATAYVCPNGHIFWNNPRATVAVVIMQDGNVLFAKRGIEPSKGRYDLPGGFLNYDEDLYSATKREMLEETSLQVSDITLLTAYTHTYIKNISVMDVVVLANSWSGTPHAADDVAELEWKPPEFINSPQFSPPYHGLSELIKQLEVADA